MASNVYEWETDVITEAHGRRSLPILFHRTRMRNTKSNPKTYDLCILFIQACIFISHDADHLEYMYGLECFAYGEFSSRSTGVDTSQSGSDNTFGNLVAQLRPGGWNRPGAEHSSLVTMQ